MTEPVIDDQEAALHRGVNVAEGQTLLEARDLTVKFGGLTALDSVSFAIRRGEILGLIGESGAGKSTIGLASMAYARAGCKITCGQIKINGVDAFIRYYASAT